MSGRRRESSEKSDDNDFDLEHVNLVPEFDTSDLDRILYGASAVLGLTILLSTAYLIKRFSR